MQLLPFDGVISYADRCRVVTMNQRFWLGMSHIQKGLAEYNAILTIVKKGIKFCLSS